MNLYDDTHESITTHALIPLLQHASLEGFCTLLGRWEEYSDSHVKVLMYTAPKRHASCPPISCRDPGEVRHALDAGVLVPSPAGRAPGSPPAELRAAPAPSQLWSTKN